MGFAVVGLDDGCIEGKLLVGTAVGNAVVGTRVSKPEELRAV